MTAPSGKDAFDRAFDELMAHEGGYVDDPADPGGETRFGISKRSYPDLDIAALTRDDARVLYRRDWWERYGYGEIHDAAIAAKLFGLAVNMGPDDAHLVAQRALRAAGRPVKEDGILGPVTRAAINAAIDAGDGAVLLAAMRSEAAGYYRLEAATRRSAGRFLKGWLNRAYA